MFDRVLVLQAWTLAENFEDFVTRTGIDPATDLEEIREIILYYREVGVDVSD